MRGNSSEQLRLKSFAQAAVVGFPIEVLDQLGCFQLREWMELRARVPKAVEMVHALHTRLRAVSSSATSVAELVNACDQRTRHTLAML